MNFIYFFLHFDLALRLGNCTALWRTNNCELSLARASRLLHSTYLTGSRTREAPYDASDATDLRVFNILWRNWQHPKSCIIVRFRPVHRSKLFGPAAQPSDSSAQSNPVGPVSLTVHQLLFRLPFSKKEFQTRLLFNMERNELTSYEACQTAVHIQAHQMRLLDELEIFTASAAKVVLFSIVFVCLFVFCLSAR